MAYRVRALSPREILIETGSLTRRGRVSGYLLWFAWSAVVILLIHRSGGLDSPLPGARLLLAVGLPALLSLGALPAMLVAHASSLGARDRLVFDHDGLLADGARVIRWTEPLVARVLQGHGAPALVIRQARARVVLFGRGIESCLGDCRSRGQRWQGETGDDGSGAIWSGAYLVRGVGDATISGQVEPSEPLAALVTDVLRLAELASEEARPERVR